MAKTFTQHRDLETLDSLLQCAHIVAGARSNGARIVAVMAGNGSQKARNILDAVADRSTVIDRIGNRHASAHRHQSPSRLQSGDPAPTGRSSDGTTLVTAESHLHFTRRYQGGAASRGASRTVLGIVGIADWAGGTGMAAGGKAKIFASRFAGDSSTTVENA